ncbi:hypothetical protein BUALT_Bualt06G0044000 [Buddleja alternifolia]|uniref:Uncharacterized protein n=1 Tax=Buddleja alternifolia TaxID=168488 RepID=A0AAV6XNK8_9LAMI|nr:hypothetical protein BUALT_Bualt06G0044000 [Buddleja alternifolia]
MRCFSCGTSWNYKKSIIKNKTTTTTTTKTPQHHQVRLYYCCACLYPSTGGHEINEAVKVLATKSREQHQIILNSTIKLISQSKDESKEQEDSRKRKKITFDDSNENRKSEKKREKCADEGVDSNANHQEDLLVDDKKESTLDNDNNNNNNWGIVGGGCCVIVEPESSESLFSLSIDSRKQFCGVAMGDKEVTSLLRENISIVSNKIVVVDNENLSQVAKVKQNQPKISNYEDDKENEEKWAIIPFSEEPILEQQSVEEKSRLTTIKSVDNHEIAVDTSLSSWLVVSDKSPKSRGSQKNDKDRQILGAITPKELKRLNESSPPQSSPSCSDDAGIGTVGSYWRHMARVHLAEE